jgi:hypothetical protein
MHWEWQPLPSAVYANDLKPLAPRSTLQEAVDAALQHHGKIEGFTANTCDNPFCVLQKLLERQLGGISNQSAAILYVADLLKEICSAGVQLEVQCLHRDIVSNGCSGQRSMSTGTAVGGATLSLLMRAVEMLNLCEINKNKIKYFSIS